METLQGQMEQVQLEIVEYVTKVATLEGELNYSSENVMLAMCPAEKLKYADSEKSSSIEKLTSEMKAEIDRITESSQETIASLKGK